MPSDGKKGLTVKIDTELHAEIRQYLESHSMTMAEFVTLALQDELHPKFSMKEDDNMEKMRTLAFQVPESLFQRIKDYLTRNNMTQKEFMLRLIENELQRDLTESRTVNDADDYGNEADDEYEQDTEEYTGPDATPAVSDCETVCERSGDYADEQDESELSGEFEDEHEDEEENTGFAMVM